VCVCVCVRRRQLYHITTKTRLTRFYKRVHVIRCQDNRWLVAVACCSTIRVGLPVDLADPYYWPQQCHGASAVQRTCIHLDCDTTYTVGFIARENEFFVDKLYIRSRLMQRTNALEGRHQRSLYIYIYIYIYRLGLAIIRLSPTV